MIEVSIIIPTYKPGDYLYECLKCLIAQTIDSCRFEIIIVLNGPKSPYYGKLEKFIKKTDDISIKLIHIEKNGVSLARNKGLEFATGTYIGFIDDDDLVSLNYIESLISISEHNAIVCSNVKTFRENLNNIGEDYLSRAYQNNKLGNKKNILFYRSFLSSACAKLMPREVLKERHFNTSFAIGEDALFVASITDNIKNIILASEDTIYYRRIRNESSSRKKRNFNFEIRNAFKLMLEYCKIYFRSPFKYNLPFFLTREIAVFRNFVNRIR